MKFVVGNGLYIGRQYVEHLNTFISGIDGISEGDEAGFDLVFDVGDLCIYSYIAQSATINPLAADFDLYAPDNVETVITWNDATAIASINDGSDNLVLDTDYTVTDIDGSTATLAILGLFHGCECWR